MDEILNQFPNSSVRTYKDGFEIRTRNLEYAVELVQSIIKRKNLNVEIFERDPSLRSLSVRYKTN